MYNELCSSRMYAQFRHTVIDTYIHGAGENVSLKAWVFKKRQITKKCWQSRVALLSFNWYTPVDPVVENLINLSPCFCAGNRDCASDLCIQLEFADKMFLWPAIFFDRFPPEQSSDICPAWLHGGIIKRFTLQWASPLRVRCFNQLLPKTCKTSSLKRFIINSTTLRSTLQASLCEYHFDVGTRTV